MANLINLDIVKQFKKSVVEKSLARNDIVNLYNSGLINFMLEEKYLVLIDYYCKVGDLSSINVRDKYLFNGKEENIGNKINEIRKVKNKGLMSDLDIDFFKSLGIKFFAKNIEVLEAFCKDDNNKLKNLPRKKVLFNYEGVDYDIKRIIGNLNSQHPNGDGIDKKELKRFLALGLFNNEKVKGNYGKI